MSAPLLDQVGKPVAIGSWQRAGSEKGGIRKMLDHKDLRQSTATKRAEKPDFSGAPDASCLS
jgi:hypothetical protein